VLKGENQCTKVYESVSNIIYVILFDLFAATIQQTNSSVKMACESFAVLKQKAKRDEEEHLLHYNESKTVVTDLRKNISDKDKIIENLRLQIHQVII